MNQGSKKIEVKFGGKTGLVGQTYPVDFNNDKSARFNPKGMGMKVARESMPKKI